MKQIIGCIAHSFDYNADRSLAWRHHLYFDPCYLRSKFCDVFRSLEVRDPRRLKVRRQMDHQLCYILGCRVHLQRGHHAGHAPETSRNDHKVNSSYDFRRRCSYHHIVCMSLCALVIAQCRVAHPLQWKVGFALVSACMVSLSLGLIVGTRPLAFSFMIASTDRKAGKSDVAAALSFTPSVFGGMARHLRRSHKLLHRHHHGGSCDPVAVNLHVDPARVDVGGSNGRRRCTCDRAIVIRSCLPLILAAFRATTWMRHFPSRHAFDALRNSVLFHLRLSLIVWIQHLTAN